MNEERSIDNSILKISSVSYEDAGYYECIAENGVALAIRSNFSIYIRGRVIM